MVYYQLAIATVGGNAHHVIKQHEDDKNGYGAWKALCEVYDRGDLKNEIADSLRSKLESYNFISAPNAAKYINNLLASF